MFYLFSGSGGRRSKLRRNASLRRMKMSHRLRSPKTNAKRNTNVEKVEKATLVFIYTFLFYQRFSHAIDL